MNNSNIKILVVIIILLIITSFLLFDIKYNHEKTIYTFWEPKDKIPGYLSLCIKTWKKFLPEYTIIILDYQKAKELLGGKLFSRIICNKMLTMVQTDAIRVAILNKFGGIWMDSDNIIINGDFIRKNKNSELYMVFDKNVKIPFICYIYAAKKSIVIKQWLRQIIINVKKFKELSSNKENTSNWIESWKKANSWYYLGNGIINNLIKHTTNENFLGIHFNDIAVFPDIRYINNSNLNYVQKYHKFFFERGDPQIIMNISKDLIFLRNSWTPLKYKQMSENEFLNQDIRLSKLFSHLLNPKIFIY